MTYHTRAGAPAAAKTMVTSSNVYGEMLASNEQIGTRRSTGHSGKINLRAVSDVLATYGMDPIEEIAKILAAKEVCVDRNGVPIIDPQTGQPMVKPVLPPDIALRTHLELLQYTRAKLKSVEVTMKEQDLTEAQIDNRLKALMARTVARDED